MTHPGVSIRALTPTDRPAWQALWKDYCTFYGEDLPAATTDTTWARLVDPSSAMKGWGAFADGQEAGNVLVGFAHTVLHPHTWSPKTLCYLEDLFVAEQARGRDVGHRLIVHLQNLAAEKGWARVYWHTEVTNTRARRLYDRFQPADEYVRYTLKT